MAATTKTRRASRACKSEHAGMSMHAVTVSRVEPLTPHLVRITFSADTLADFLDDGPDQRFKLLLPHPGQQRPVMPPEDGWYEAWLAMPVDVRPIMRTYTVRRARTELGELDIDVVLHGDEGPASRWASRVRVGDEVAILAAYGEYEVPPAAQWQLLVGDQTALPALAAILERLPHDAQGVTVLLEVPGPEERLALTAPPGVDVRWLDAAPGRPGAALVGAVRAVEEQEGPGYAWVCADSNTVKTIRRHLVEDRGMLTDAIMFMGYWRTDGAIDDL